jgi:hypothetical protein
MHEYLKDVAWAERAAAAIKKIVNTETMRFVGSKLVTGGIGEHYSIGPYGMTIQLQFCEGEEGRAMGLSAGVHFLSPDNNIVAALIIVGTSKSRIWRILYKVLLPDDPFVQEMDVIAAEVGVDRREGGLLQGRAKAFGLFRVAVAKVRERVAMSSSVS